MWTNYGACGQTMVSPYWNIKINSYFSPLKRNEVKKNKWPNYGGKGKILFLGS